MNVSFIQELTPEMEDASAEVCVMLIGNLDRNVVLSLRPGSALDTAIGI